MISRLEKNSNRGYLSETSKYRDELVEFCHGYGIDLGYGGDPIKPSSMAVDLPTPYTEVGNHPLNLGGDARDLSWFTDNSLDYVYSSHLLEDFENTLEVLLEWVRVIKKAGRLVLLLPDQRRYEAYCTKAGTEPNQAHKIKDFSLAYLKEQLAAIPYIKIIYEKDYLDDYCFIIVAEKIQDTPTHQDCINYRNCFNALNTEIQEKDREAAQLRRTLRDTQRSLASLYASRSWRVTRPLRLIDNCFREWRKSPALFKDFFARRELRTTGWPGLIHRFKKLIEMREDEGPYSRSNDYTKGMVTIAILTKNRLDLIKPCIESIENNLSKKYQVEILIGDRGSTDRPVVSFYNDAIEKYGNIEVIDYSRYSLSNNYNQLIKINANGQFLILLRDDMIVHGDWIDRLIDSLEDKRIGLVAGKIISVDNTIQHAGMEFNENGLGVEIYKNRPNDYPEANYKAYVPVATLAGAAMRHDVFDRFQLNEAFTGEARDADFCLRLAEAGFKVLYNPEVEICHPEGASRGWWQGYRERRLLRRKWGQRIQALAAQKHQRSGFDENAYKNSITIIRDDGIGDLLMGLSAFKKLKHRHPEKKLILLTYQRNIEMMSGFKIFDEFLPIPDQEKYAPLPIPKDSQTYNFIDLEMVFGNIWGRPKEDNKVHRHLIYSRDLELDNSFELVPMPDYPEAKQKVIKLFQELKIDLNQIFVVLNLTATNPARSWWAAYYPKLIESIEEMGFIPLVVGTEDSEYFTGKKLINLVNKTKTIAEYIEVVKLSKYVISTDTSAYHIAALSGIPFLAIFTGGIKPESRLTYYSKYEVVEPPADLKCYPCWDQGCTDLSIRWKNDPCRMSVTPEVVIEKFKKLVETYPQH